MITTNNELQKAQETVQAIRTGLSAFVDGAGADMHPLLRKARIDSQQSMLEELERDIDEYLSLTTGKIKDFLAYTLSDLPKILVRARIARQLSVAAFAGVLGITGRTLLELEDSHYRTASFDLLRNAAAHLDVDVSHIQELAVAKSVPTPVWNEFPIKEMYKRGWFEDFGGSLAEAKKAAADLVPNFFRMTGTNYAMAAMHRKSTRATAAIPEQSLLAWEARVSFLAERDPPSARFQRENISTAWLKSLVSASVLDDGPRRAIGILREIGIALVFEPHLEHTHLDGAAIMRGGDLAVVALTLRHDRIDNFWFTLMHEIAHLALHFKAGEASAIFDDNDSEATTDVEKEADAFAGSALISDQAWAMSASRYLRSEASVLTDAKRLQIHPAIIAGRIRKESDNYIMFKDLVGSGKVRELFRNQGA